MSAEEDALDVMAAVQGVMPVRKLQALADLLELARCTETTTRRDENFECITTVSLTIRASVDVVQMEGTLEKMHAAVLELMMRRRADVGKEKEP